jgi:nitroreductase
MGHSGSVDLDLDTVDRLLTTTRAVRKRLDLTRPVPPEVITECLRLATQAPTAGDAQGWRFVAVTEERQRSAIAAVHRAGNEDYVRAELTTASGPARRRLESALYLIEHLHEVPVHVLAFVLTGPEPPLVRYGSIFPAVWSFQLALRSRGLGTTPMFVADEPAVAEIVGAPAGASLAALLPVAYYIGTSFKPAPRRPVEEVLFWNRWSD